MTSRQDWLLVIDMQPGFGRPDSPWCVPGFEACAQNVTRLVDAFGPRVRFTRFVPPADPQGAWQPYYADFPFAVDPQNRALWDLDARWADRPSIASPRFAKWREAAPLLPTDAEVVLCGVSTECCVMGTALEANDDGRKVRLVADACAAGTEPLHQAALTILSDRPALVEMSDTDRELARIAATTA